MLDSKLAAFGLRPRHAIDSDAANVPSSTANTPAPAEFAAASTAERFIGNLGHYWLAARDHFCTLHGSLCDLLPEVEWGHAANRAGSFTRDNALEPLVDRPVRNGTLIPNATTRIAFLC